MARGLIRNVAALFGAAAAWRLAAEVKDEREKAVEERRTGPGRRSSDPWEPDDASADRRMSAEPHGNLDSGDGVPVVERRRPRTQARVKITRPDGSVDEVAAETTIDPEEIRRRAARARRQLVVEPERSPAPATEVVAPETPVRASRIRTLLALGSSVAGAGATFYALTNPLELVAIPAAGGGLMLAVLGWRLSRQPRGAAPLAPE